MRCSKEFFIKVYVNRTLITFANSSALEIESGKTLTVAKVNGAGFAYAEVVCKMWVTMADSIITEKLRSKHQNM